MTKPKKIKEPKVKAVKLSLSKRLRQPDLRRKQPALIKYSGAGESASKWLQDFLYQ